MAEINLTNAMRERVKHHMVKSQNERARNPAIPNDIFDFSRSGLPSDFVYHPVEIPNSASPLYATQLGILNAYLHQGFEFLTTDLATRDGRNGTAVIPNLVEIDGRVAVGGCYILFASRDWYDESRARNVKKRNDILAGQTDSREEAMEQLGGNRQLRRVESKRTDVTLDELNKEEESGGEDD